MRSLMVLLTDITLLCLHFGAMISVSFAMEILIA